MIKVSVIIPFYNRANSIKDCLMCVLNQTLREIEVICVDDGSSDDTLNILNSIKESDERIQVIHKNNGGAGSARNEGIRTALGEYVAFLDSDDCWVNEDVLEKLYVISKKYNANICKAKLFSKSDKIVKLIEETSSDKIGYTNYKNIKSGFYFYSYLYRREFLVNNGIFFPNLYIYEDPSFLLKAIVKSERILCTDIDYYVYNTKHQREIIRNEKQTIDYLKGLELCLRITSEFKLVDIHNNTYQELACQASDDFVRCIPSNNKDLLISLLHAYNAVNFDLLYSRGKMGLPEAFGFLWNSSNNYMKIRKNAIFKMIYKISGKE